ncbi:MAG TPA: hypothetical protein VLM38_14415 [Blastocatellia bacterium]|nr:hypothetical protein [Blastocatellia bacterium]
MFEKIKRILFGSTGDEHDEDEGQDDRDAGVPVPVRRSPPDRGSSVAVAEPDDDEEA